MTRTPRDIARLKERAQQNRMELARHRSQMKVDWLAVGQNFQFEGERAPPPTGRTERRRQRDTRRFSQLNLPKLENGANFHYWLKTVEEAFIDLHTRREHKAVLASSLLGRVFDDTFWTKYYRGPDIIRWDSFVWGVYIFLRIRSA